MNAGSNSQILGGLATLLPRLRLERRVLTTTRSRSSTSSAPFRAATWVRVAKDINKIIASYDGKLPKGTRIVARGQMQTMEASYTGLMVGLAGAILLVYLLIVINFQSWLHPFIIITALPAAIAGIAWMLLITGTTLSVPALTGAIMCMGVATANSILMVSFARGRMDEGANAQQAAIEAGITRFRPVLMTALAMIIGMLPMALGLGEGGEQNAPLGRAVIGGLLLPLWRRCSSCLLCSRPSMVAAAKGHAMTATPVTALTTWTSFMSQTHQSNTFGSPSRGYGAHRRRRSRRGGWAWWGGEYLLRNAQNAELKESTEAQAFITVAITKAAGAGRRYAAVVAWLGSGQYRRTDLAAHQRLPQALVPRHRHAGEGRSGAGADRCP